LIHKSFFDNKTKSYSSGTQIDIVYPMFVGATPQSEIDNVEKSLWARTIEQFKGHLATGLVGIPIITQWATREGKAEEMYQMLKKREYPGYLYMIDNGADLTWEHWDGDRSRIHNCYNGIGSWFYQALGGITPDEKQPGYKHINIRPQIVDAIDWVKVSKDTPYGKLYVSWEKAQDELKINLTIPVGSTATLHTPDGKSILLGSGNHSINCNRLPKN
jgi:alpha-L-rhamnosidase